MRENLQTRNDYMNQTSRLDQTILAIIANSYVQYDHLYDNNSWSLNELEHTKLYKIGMMHIAKIQC